MPKPITVFDLKGIGGQYGLFVPHSEEPLVALPVPIAVRYGIVSDKRVDADEHDGLFVRVSRRRTELASALPLEPLTNLRVRLVANEAEPTGDICTKVVSADAVGVMFRFTACSPLMEERLMRLCAIEPSRTPGSH